MSFTLAWPGNGVVVVILQNICVDLPCSTALRSMLKATNGGAISSVNSCDDVQMGPLPASAMAMKAVFHFFTLAPPFALTGKSTSLCSGAIVTAEAEPTPGGLNNG